MSAAIWIIFGLGVLAYGAQGAHNNHWPSNAIVGAIVGGVVAVVVMTISMMSLRKLVTSPSSSALQKFMLLSFGLKLIAAVVLAVLAQFLEDKHGPLLDLEATLLTYLGLVFFGFALQGSLLEAPSGSSGSDKRQPEDSQTGQSQ